MATSLPRFIFEELASLLAPLGSVDSAGTARALLRDLGWEPPGATLQGALGTAAAKVEAFVSAAQDLAAADEGAMLEKASIAMLASAEVFAAIRTLDSEIDAALANDQAYREATEIASRLPERLLHYLVATHLERNHPQVYGTMRLLGAIEEISHDADEAKRQTRFVERKLRFERLKTASQQPLSLLQQLYFENEQFVINKVFDAVVALCAAAGIPAGVYPTHRTIGDAFPGASATELRFPVLRLGDAPGTYAEGGLIAAAIPGPGVLVVPYAIGALAARGTPSGRWDVGASASASLDTGFGLIARLPRTFEVRQGVLAQAPAAATQGWFEAWAALRTAGRDFLVCGTAEGSRLSIGALTARARFDAAGGNELAVEAELSRGRFVLGGSRDDSFLAEILGDGVDCTFDATVGWSTGRGVYFRGSSTLEIAIPIHRSLGPITLDVLQFSLAPTGGKLQAQVGASLAAKLGPVTATVDRVGVTATLAFDATANGNLGFIDVGKLLFLPPRGAGLSVDAGGVTGGGFLQIDSKNGRYAGVLGLKFGEIGLTAIGLITTRDPVSILINIGVIFDPAIQLSMGFTLNGVGGLIGINRDMLVAELQKGLKNHTLDSVLFPDPATVVENAPRIISDLEAVFPATEGRYVVGPMVKIGWGSPSVITGDIGIFLALPDPIIVVLLGQVAASFPTPDAAVVELNMDVLGVLEPAKKQLSFQSALHDSSVLTYTLLGESAFLLKWGDSPEFGLAIGGFHPKYDPPPPPQVFSGLERLRLDMSSGKNFSMSCRGYFALTPNSLQLGARIDVEAKASGARLAGDLSFDALVVFSPFSLEVQINGGVHVEYKGYELASVRLRFTLTGPTPWRARGKASFEVLKWDVDVDFTFKWGSNDERSVPSADPFPRVAEAIRDLRSWGSALPRGRVVEQLRSRTGADEEVLVVHPAGALEIRQRVAPLNLSLSRFGHAPVKGHDLISIQAVTAGHEVNGQFVSDEPDGASPRVEPVLEHFARGQFESLSNQQKLSVPAFEKMVGGARSGRDDSVKVGTGWNARELAYESILLGKDLLAEVQPNPGRLPFTGEGVHLTRGGARAKQVVRGLGRFGTAANAKVRVGEPMWTIVNKSDLTRVDPGLGDMTRAEADRVFATRVTANPARRGRELVVPSYEVEEAAA